MRDNPQNSEVTDRLLAEVIARVELERGLGADVFRSIARSVKPSPKKPEPSRVPKQPHAEDPERRAKLEELRRAIENCQQCPLGATRTKFVFGTGNSSARLMFVGEAPGRDEDLQGEPFVGRAGTLLTRMINAMGLDRDEVFIGNILKCRPPENRQPTIAEMAVCLPYILQQIDIIKPEIVCALGATALKGLLRDPHAAISQMRGKFIAWREIKLMPTFHPAYLLRSPGEKRKVWEDLQKVMAELGLPLPKQGDE